MATSQRRYLVCKNVSCHHAIWLPYSSQLGKSPDHLDFDSRYFEMFVCPGCAHVYDYRSRNVRRRLPQSQDRDQLLGLCAVSLAFRCGEQNCGSLVVIHKPSRENQDDSTVVSESSLWALGDVHCPKGHRIRSLPPESERWVRVLANLGDPESG